MYVRRQTKSIKLDFHFAAMPKIVSVKSLGHICVDFIANNIDSFPKESLPSELEVIDSEKAPFYFEELRNPTNFLIQHPF